MDTNENRRAEDAERLPAEELEWVEPKSLGDLLMPKAQRDAILARHAAPAVDAAELGKLKALAAAATPGEWERGPDLTVLPDYGGGTIARLSSTRGKFEYEAANADFIAAANPAAILRIAALVAQQAARIAAHPEARWQALCIKAVAVLNRHIVPDGISDHEALAELYGIFDGPEYRAIADIAQDRCDADQAQAMQMDKQIKMMTATQEGK